MMRKFNFRDRLGRVAVWVVAFVAACIITYAMLWVLAAVFYPKHESPPVPVEIVSTPETPH